MVKPVILIDVATHVGTGALVYYVTNLEKTSGVAIVLSRDELKNNGSDPKRLLALLSAKFEQGQISMEEWIKDHPDG